MTGRVSWLCGIAIMALALAADLAKPPTADVGFFLYAAGRMLDGGHLYRDVVDLNLPLIFAANMPVVLLARATGLSPFLLYGFASALVLGCLLLYSARLTFRYVLPDQPARARDFLLLLCFVLFAFPGFDFGEREHFVLGLLLPYLLVVAAQCAGREVLRGDRLAAGVLCGFAIGLKPHFIVVWLALEGLDRIRCSQKRRWRLTAESAATLGVVTVYGAAVVALTPEYLHVLGVLGPAYALWLREPFLGLLVFGPAFPLVACAMLSLAALRRTVTTPALVIPLAWATGACWIAGSLQEKEFRYHFYPAMGLAFVLLGVLALGAGRKEENLAERVFRRTSQALLVTTVAVVLVTTVRDAAGLNPLACSQWAELRNMVAEVRARAQGRPVAVFSHTTGSAFPLVNYAGVGLASRFPSFWMATALYWDAIAAREPLRYRSAAERGPAERYLLDAVREDLTAAQPPLLIVLRPARDDAVNNQRRFNFMTYFDTDPQIAALLARYRLATRIGEHLLFERVDAGSPATGPPPSAVRGTLDVGRTGLTDLRLSSLDPEWLVGVAGLAVTWLALAIRDRRRMAR